MATECPVDDEGGFEALTMEGAATVVFFKLGWALRDSLGLRTPETSVVGHETLRGRALQRDSGVGPLWRWALHAD